MWFQNSENNLMGRFEHDKILKTPDGEISRQHNPEKSGWGDFNTAEFLKIPIGKFQVINI